MMMVIIDGYLKLYYKSEIRSCIEEKKIKSQ